MNLKNIKLTDIRIDGGTQARVAISVDAVDDYAEAVTAGVSLPPIVVFHDGAAYWLADGFHRLHANRKIGAVTIDADVRNGTQADAQLFAYGANQAHGLRRTNDDKRKAVLGVLGLKPDWSDRAVAKHVGVTHPFVAAERRSLVTVTSEDAPNERTYTTKHGTQAKMDVSGQKKAGEAKRATAAAKEQQPVPASTSAPEPAREDDGGASAEEMLFLEEQIAADQERVRILLESDEPLAAMTEKCKQLQAHVLSLEANVRGLTNTNAELIREVKKWQRIADKAQQAAKQ